MSAEHIPISLLELQYSGISVWWSLYKVATHSVKDELTHYHLQPVEAATT